MYMYIQCVHVLLYIILNTTCTISILNTCRFIRELHCSKKRKLKKVINRKWDLSLDLLIHVSSQVFLPSEPPDTLIAEVHVSSQVFLPSEPPDTLIAEVGLY